MRKVIMTTVKTADSLITEMNVQRIKLEKAKVVECYSLDGAKFSAVFFITC